MGKINMATTTINTLLSLVQTAFNANKLQVQYGGTGVTSYNDLRSQLGLGNNVSNPLPVSCGGTGVTNLTALKGAILSEGSTAMGVTQGGTGRDSLTANAVIYGNGTNQVGMASASNPGVLQVNSANSAPTFGVVPVALGGTGVTTKSLLSNLLGLGGGTESGNNITYDPIPVGRGGTGRTNLNSVSNDLGLGETINSAIPLSRGGTGVMAGSAGDVLQALGAVSVNGDSRLKGNYNIDGNVLIQNTANGVTLYDLSTRLKDIESNVNNILQRLTALGG